MASKRKRKDNNPDSDYVVVYSTEAPKPKFCNGCRREEQGCVCAPTAYVGKLNPAARIERKGRAGKAVTVLFRLPAHETLLKDLCSALKRSLGGGGTYYIEDGEGFIEIQGEKRQEALAFVLKHRS